MTTVVTGVARAEESATKRRTSARPNLVSRDPSSKVTDVERRLTWGFTVMPALRITGSLDGVQPVNCRVWLPGGTDAGMVIRPLAMPSAPTVRVPSDTGVE